ncbi:hypothetical protein ACO0LO_13655 [Undibacterium sp. TJN25]|uniref:hypothetical protein n=1 Tax=Undibacterium sp. TJN25 TaxID=3413056 RepID=UPI003BF0B441
MRFKSLLIVAVIAATASLSGCVVYPARGGYGYGGGPGVYVEPAPVVVAPAYYGGWGYRGRRW